ncbi:hypothetical protein M3Y95_01094100 [Aphelenchoides besseyi]|nr:hypothetical protein M3Y95_01094100 [Aphelenchoides besseyi]
MTTKRVINKVVHFILYLHLLGSISTSVAKSFYKRAAELRELQEIFAQMPPHCSRAIVSSAAPSFLLGSQSTNPKMKLNAAVGHTICFRSLNQRNSTDGLDVLHTLTLERLEQYYPVSQRYRFAIPEVETRCICECQAEAQTCQAADYQYGKCPEESVESTNGACYRTFFADQPSIGCPSGHAEEPKLCCELRFRPFQNRTFTAVRLETPTTFAVLRYAAYEWSERGRWTQADRRSITIHLDGSTQTQLLDTQKQLELTVTSAGQPANQLESAMYFAEMQKDGTYGNLRRQPLNEITEHSFEKLGWLRVNPEDQTYVQGGFVLMDKIHKAKAENCLEQKYQSILDANYYVNKESNDTTRFKLAEPLDTTMRWVKRARIVDTAERHAIVDASEGTNLEISLSSLISDSSLAFVHNASRVDDFGAVILVDRFSNSVLNLTVYNATGVLNGYVKHLNDQHGATIDSFTVPVPDGESDRNGIKTLVVRVKPYELNSQHMVCIRPDDGHAPEMCRLATSVHLSLETNTMDNRWHDVRGSCLDCNRFSVEGFMHFLNPANWVKGVHSVSDAVVLLSDICGYGFLILLAYLLIFKLIIPLIKCFVCPVSLFNCSQTKK